MWHVAGNRESEIVFGFHFEHFTRVRGMGHFQVECNATQRRSWGATVQPYAAKVLKIALPWALHVAGCHSYVHWPEDTRYKIQM